MTNPFDKDDVRHILWSNLQLLREQHEWFELMFHVPLKRYWIDNMYGFNLVKFDEEVIQSGDRCMSDVVLEKYGEEGVRLIRILIGGGNQCEEESGETTESVLSGEGKCEGKS